MTQHILHITPYYAPAYEFGGVVRAVEGMAGALVARGHRVTVLTTDALTITERGDLPRDTMHNGVRVLRVPNRLYPLRRLNLSTPFGMAAIAKQILHDVDVVHLHEFRTIENLLIAPLAAQHNTPMVLSPHGTMTLSTGRSTMKQLWDSLLSPRVTRHIARVIALVNAEADDVRQVWSRFGLVPPIEIVPNGIHRDNFTDLPDPSDFRARYGLGDARVVLFMGRLHERKGVANLTRAFLQADMPNTKLVLAGPDEGMLATLQALAANSDDVILTGYLSGDDRLAALAAADLFVLPAIGEGLSMAVLEAMAAGLPALLSYGCNLPEVAEADAGLVIEPTVDAITVSLQQMFADADSLTHMGNNARQLVADRFTWSHVAHELEAVYSLQ